MKEFWGNIDKAFLTGTTVLVGIVLGFFYWVIPPNKSFPAWSIMVVVIVAYIICLILYAIFCIPKKIQAIFTLPEVKSISIVDSTVIFLVEKSELYIMNSLVTLCKEDEAGIEIYFAIGYVETFNNKGNMQVKVYSILNRDIYDAVISHVDDNKSLKFLKVKPTISKDNLGGQDNE